MKISRRRFLFSSFWVCPSVHVIVNTTCIRVFSLRGNYCHSSEHTEVSWVIKSIRIMPNWSVFFDLRFSGISMSFCIWARFLVWVHMAHTANWRMERWLVLNEYEYEYEFTMLLLLNQRCETNLCLLSWPFLGYFQHSKQLCWWLLRVSWREVTLTVPVFNWTCMENFAACRYLLGSLLGFGFVWEIATNRTLTSTIFNNPASALKLVPSVVPCAI